MDDKDNPYKPPSSRGAEQPTGRCWPMILVWLVAVLLLVHVVVAAILYYLWKIGVIGPPLTD